MEIILMIPVLLFSVIAHEVAHGYAAYVCGDSTAKYSGRLTFNPLPHIDLFGSIIFPALLLLTHSPVLIGWAKPVPVNPNNFRRPRRDDLLVSLAGVTMNLLLAVLFTVLLATYINLLSVSMRDGLAIMLDYGIKINVVLAVFNMIPVPPLDGSWVLYHLLPDSLAREYKKIFPYGFLILLLLIMTNTLSFIMLPVLKAIMIVLRALELVIANS